MAKRKSNRALKRKAAIKRAIQSILEPEAKKTQVAEAQEKAS